MGLPSAYCKLVHSTPLVNDFVIIYSRDMLGKDEILNKQSCSYDTFWKGKRLQSDYRPNFRPVWSTQCWDPVPYPLGRPLAHSFSAPDHGCYVLSSFFSQLLRAWSHGTAASCSKPTAVSLAQPQAPSSISCHWPRQTEAAATTGKMKSWYQRSKKLLPVKIMLEPANRNWGWEMKLLRLEN